VTIVHGLRQQNYLSARLAELEPLQTATPLFDFQELEAESDIGREPTAPFSAAALGFSWSSSATNLRKAPLQLMVPL